MGVGVERPTWGEEVCRIRERQGEESAWSKGSEVPSEESPTCTPPVLDMLTDGEAEAQGGGRKEIFKGLKTY